MATTLLYIYLIGFVGFETRAVYQCVNEEYRIISKRECIIIGTISSAIWPVGATLETYFYISGKLGDKK